MFSAALRRGGTATASAASRSSEQFAAVIPQPRQPRGTRWDRRFTERRTLIAAARSGQWVALPEPRFVAVIPTHGGHLSLGGQQRRWCAGGPPTSKPAGDSSSSSSGPPKADNMEKAETGAPKAEQVKRAEDGVDSAPKAEKQAEKAEDAEKNEKAETKEKEEGPKEEGKKQDKNSDKDKAAEDAEQQQWRQNMVAGAALASFAAYLHFSGEDNQIDEITTQELIKEYLIKGYVDRLRIVNHSVCYVQLNAEAPSAMPGHEQKLVRLGNPEAFEAKLEMAQASLGIPRADRVPIAYTSEVETLQLLHYIPSILLFTSMLLMARGMMNGNPMGGLPGRGGFGGPMGGGGMGGGRNIFNIGKAQISSTKSTTKFADVAGAEQAKREVVEFVDFLKDPSKYEKLGARIPKGGLLVGPPGTGKTLLAKAVAGEADCPFFSTSGSDFVEMFAGVGPSRVRDLFKQARDSAPSIIFIDEIDAIGKKRSSGGGMGGGNDERENTLNQMLVEMDGFSSGTGVVVLAGTNRVDTLDNALTRPGRFDRQIAVDKPDLREREQIYMVHLKPVTVSDQLSKESVAKRMASLTPGFAGADIANVCNEAAIFAARREASAVEMEDFERATERVLAGYPKGGLFDERQRHTVAVHESGHAVAGWFLEHADPLLKVSIVPRSNGAGGFAQYLPQEIALHSKESILDKIAVALAGRAAEELFVGKISTGASDDLDRVTKMAYAMVTTYGMIPGLGLLSYNDNSREQFYKPYSEATNTLIDREARKLVHAEYERIKELLESKRDIVISLSEALKQKETLVYNEILDILGDRPFGFPEEVKQYVSASGRSPFEMKSEEPAENAPASHSPETPAPVMAASAPRDPHLS